MFRSPPDAPLTALDPRVAAWVRQGAAALGPCETVIETSISWVFLFKDRALKLKKPVNFGFVDFTTVERRGWATQRELAFNQPAAPDLYLAAHAITQERDGRLAFDGQGVVLDWALEMRRFEENALLLKHLPADGSLGEALGRLVAARHLNAPQGRAGGGGAGLSYVTDSNALQLRACAKALGSDDVERFIDLAERAMSRAWPQLDARLAAGFCRACHGDLHAANIVIRDGAPVLFDCIEFNDRLREIDIQYDLAFLLMDLSFRQSQAAANRALNGWLDAVARELGDAVYDGLDVLALQQATRAAVRAHVCAREGKIAEGRAYLTTALDALAPSPPRLLAVGGLSGSGKTTLARSLAPAMGTAPGAVILRSDEIRKRLWSAQPQERLNPKAYSPDASRQVYDELRRLAGLCLAAGKSVIADAAFLEPQERRAIAEAARGFAFEGIWLDAPTGVLAQRVAARRGDASDADLAVLTGQIGRDLGEISWRRQASPDPSPA